jgi:hypothetical protein
LGAPAINSTYRPFTDPIWIGSVRVNSVPCDILGISPPFIQPAPTTLEFGSATRKFSTRARCFWTEALMPTQLEPGDIIKIVDPAGLRTPNRMDELNLRKMRFESQPPSLCAVAFDKDCR